MSATEAPTLRGETPPPVAAQDGARRRRGRVPTQLVVGACIIGVLILVALLAPVLAPHDPEAIGTNSVFGAPSWAHPLGSDESGRDVLSRLLYAYRVSLGVAIGSVALSLVVSVPIGLLAGYHGGWTDTLLMRPIDMMLAFPALLFAITLIAVVGASSLVTLLAISVIYVPLIARVMRASTLTVSTMPYVDAARSRGSHHLRTMAVHVLPNAIGPVLVQASVLAGIAIQVEAALSFIGLGAQPPTPSLGQMLASGRNFLEQAPWIEIFPGIAIAISVLGFLLIGDGLRSKLDPRGIAR